MAVGWDGRGRKKTILPLVIAAVAVVFALLFIGGRGTSVEEAPPEEENALSWLPFAAEMFRVKAPPPNPEWIMQELLPINDYSRPGTPLKKIDGVVVHYVGNPGTTARQNYSYFNQLATTMDTYASSHFIVGLEGEIYQSVPLDEVAYASSQANGYTLSIEVCHPDSTGKFTAATYDALIRLVNWLREYYELETDQIIRHYDVTGKECPRYYVREPEAWERFLDDLAE